MTTIRYAFKRHCLERTFPNDAGVDIRACTDSNGIPLKSGERVAVSTGIQLFLPPGWEAQIRPRSGLALKYGITVLNSPGTIDSGYTGEIIVILVRHDNDPTDFLIQDGFRIAQLVFSKVDQVNLSPWNLSEQGPIPDLQSDRQDKGFGSSGLD